MKAKMIFPAEQNQISVFIIAASAARADMVNMQGGIRLAAILAPAELTALGDGAGIDQAFGLFDWLAGLHRV